MDSTLNSGHDTAGATEAASKRQVQPYSSPGEQTSAQGAGASPSNAKGAHERSQPTRHELLRAFVDEFVVNNKNSRYPIKINEETYLTGRSIRDESDRMFVVEDYRIITPVAVTLGDILTAAEQTEKQVLQRFCGDLHGREQLFSGYSSVGIIQNITDSNGNLLFSVKVDRSQCA